MTVLTFLAFKFSFLLLFLYFHFTAFSLFTEFLDCCPNSWTVEALLCFLPKVSSTQRGTTVPLLSHCGRVCPCSFTEILDYKGGNSIFTHFSLLKEKTLPTSCWRLICYFLSLSYSCSFSVCAHESSVLFLFRLFFFLLYILMLSNVFTATVACTIYSIRHISVQELEPRSSCSLNFIFNCLLNVFTLTKTDCIGILISVWANKFSLCFISPSYVYFPKQGNRSPTFPSSFLPSPLVFFKHQNPRLLFDKQNSE